MNIQQLTENAVLLTWENRIDTEINRHVVACARAIEARPFLGFVECVPAFCSLAVYFDFFKIKKNTSAAFLFVKNEIENIVQNIDSQSFTEESQLLEIPVCYEMPFALDIEFVAAYHQKTVSEIIELHTTSIYRVFMVGFSAGFPYLGGLPEGLITPRKDTPRRKIEAGSVGIGGNQTGIYPSDSPGGWQIIGRIPPQYPPDFRQVLDFSKPDFCLFKAGQSVKFYPISLIEFEAKSKL